MRFVNESLPDGVYAGHAVIDGFTEDYSEAHAAKLVPVLSRFYGLMPEGVAPPAVVKALVEFELVAPEAAQELVILETVPELVIVPDPNIEGKEPKPNPDDLPPIEGKEPKPNPDINAPEL